MDCLKAQAAETPLRQPVTLREPVLITQNGEAKAVLQNIASYDELQETIALLKLLAMGERDIEQGRLQPMVDAVTELRSELWTEFEH